MTFSDQSKSQQNIKISIAQTNPTLGDFVGNSEIIRRRWQEAESCESDIIIFPELVVPGYNPRDLALRPCFVEECEKIITQLTEYSKNINCAAVLGTIRHRDRKTYNSAIVIHLGKIIHVHDKIMLPNYGVFDEKRLFAPGDEIGIFSLAGYRIALIICEDMWSSATCKRLISQEPDILCVINASPYSKTKNSLRIKEACSRAREIKAPVIYVNLVGLQDSIIYDGNSFVMNKSGEIIVKLEQFKEDQQYYSYNKYINSKEEPIFAAAQLYDDGLLHDSSKLEEIYHALVFALRDYTRKNNFSEVSLGFSSGIDSSLTALIAMDAIGKEKVHLYAMPSAFTSQETFTDGDEFITTNRTLYKNFEIQNLYQNFLTKIGIEEGNIYEGTRLNLTKQNLQSRIRGVILMALSNLDGSLLLSTGNKSELATGYATLYGDMNGGYNLLKDLYKTEISQLANWRNIHCPKYSLHKIGTPIPKNIIKKEPTAELSKNQKDSDSLPEYKVLDQILYYYIDLLKSKDFIIGQGFKSEIVDQVLNLVRIAQFKRYQATLGPKISDRSFDLDWRYPITNRYY